MSKVPEHVRCGNCAFWDEYIHEEDGQQAEGICRRHAPVIPAVAPDKGESTSDWPSTGSGEFCGEFRAEWPPA